MRPTAQPQSALRAPLNDVLGTEANVRVLRVLSQLREPIAAAELARTAELQPSTVHRTLKSLELTGVIEFSGARFRVALREGSPLAKPVRQLFALERQRYDAVLDALFRIGKSLSRPPIAMWVEGPVTRGVDRAGDPIIVAIVDQAREIDNTREMIRRAVEQVERTYDVTIEVRARTFADLDAGAQQLATELEDAIPLVGVPPAGLLARNNSEPRRRNQVVGMGVAVAAAVALDIRVHADHDRHGLAMGEAIAKKLIDDPTLVKRARAFLDKRWRAASARERKELAEWRSILRTSSPARLRKILTDPGERSTRLRQTLPFVGILSDDELRAIRSRKP